jgi:uncharacterized protein DUF4956
MDGAECRPSRNAIRHWRVAVALSIFVLPLPSPTRCWRFEVPERRSGILGPLRTNVPLRVAVYYVLLGSALWVVAQRLPHSELITRESLDALFGLAGQQVVSKRAAPPPLDQTALALTVGLAMVSSVLLTLPVAWVYVLTRSKRGYQQSVVQTLIMLPVVVAGIVVLVKYSLALAFSLAGIVAAVRFRFSLDDSKDAVYIFLATGIGLAAAVNVPVALVISLVFNFVMLMLWYSDFGSAPAHLEGRVADRRMQRAMETLSRTGTFVARLDKEVFTDMTAEQLEAVADRAWRRRRRNLPDVEGPAESKRESLLRVRTFDVASSRSVVEPVLDAQLKRWRYGRVVEENDGSHIVEYNVVLRKHLMPESLLERVRAECAPHVIGAELD